VGVKIVKKGPRYVTEWGIGISCRPMDIVPEVIFRSVVKAWQPAMLCTTCMQVHSWILLAWAERLRHMPSSLQPRTIHVRTHHWRTHKHSLFAGKSTLLQILAGQYMVGPEAVRILGRPAFHDIQLTSSGQLSYLGQQWRRDIAFAGYNVPIQVHFFPNLRSA